jgi:polar amino acid transport system permease protein
MPRASTPGIVEAVEEAQRRQRFRFRLIFALTWAVAVGGLIAALVAARKVDLAFISHQAPIIIAAAPLTIFISIVSIGLAIVFAVFGALGRISRVAPLYALATLYVSLVRGTPLIVQILFIYLALPQFGIVLPALPTGILALAFNYGAYMTEIFRAGIQAVPKGQLDAAHALGMTDRDTLQRIVLPQALRIVTPAIGNEFIAMIKDSALVSIVGVQEMLFYARVIGSQNFRSFETFTMAAAIYWILTIVFSSFQDRLERRFAASDRRV